MNKKPLEAASASTGRGAPQSVGRIFAILDVLSTNTKGASLSELAVHLDAPKTSLVGLLTGLTDEKCLVRDDGGRYSLGPRFISLAMRAVSGRELTKIMRPAMEKLMEKTGETAVLGALTEDAKLAIYLDRVESNNPIRYAVAVGERRELHCTAIGKVLLAHFPSDQIEQQLKLLKPEVFTEKTVTNVSEMRQDLSRILEEGIALTSDERVVGASGVAAPIYGSGGEVIAAIAVAGPTDRFLKNVTLHKECVREAAAECTRLAGGGAA
ncbi:MAG: IclR family transcriptional regulator [Sneathiella sp.]|nr:IclR family transcriptional regulator [Sneathiella sp.]